MQIDSQALGELPNLEVFKTEMRPHRLLFALSP